MQWQKLRPQTQPEALEILNEDGLTDSQFRTVTAKTNNPYLDAMERADAVMLIIIEARRKCNLMCCCAST
jgi:hypothetical protein